MYPTTISSMQLSHILNDIYDGPYHYLLDSFELEPESIQKMAYALRSTNQTFNIMVDQAPKKTQRKIVSFSTIGEILENLNNTFARCQNPFPFHITFDNAELEVIKELICLLYEKSGIFIV